MVLSDGRLLWCGARSSMPRRRLDYHGGRYRITFCEQLMDPDQLSMS